MRRAPRRELAATWRSRRVPGGSSPGAVSSGDRLTRGIQSGAVRLEAVWGDITCEQVDAIVNAANPQLAGGGGVDGAIHRAAGSAALSAACRAIGGCAPGDAVVTPGFALPARFVVHTVGPVWRGGGHGEDAILASCYRRALEVAAEVGARSVAFPAIATGVYGFPADRAAALAVRTLRSLAAGDEGRPGASGRGAAPEGGRDGRGRPAAGELLSQVIDVVRLVAFDRETYRLYTALLSGGPPPA